MDAPRVLPPSLLLVHHMDTHGLRSPRVLFAYAGFLVLAGLVAFAFSGFSFEHGKTALIVPSACAVLIAICGLMAKALPTNRPVGMIGIHLGLGLPLVFAALIGYRAFAAWQKVGTPDGKTYLAVILSVIAVGSLVAFVAVLRTRPPASARA